MRATCIIMDFSFSQIYFNHFKYSWLLTYLFLKSKCDAVVRRTFQDRLTEEQKPHSTNANKSGVKEVVLLLRYMCVNFQSCSTTFILLLKSVPKTHPQMSNEILCPYCHRYIQRLYILSTTWFFYICMSISLRWK